MNLTQTKMFRLLLVNIVYYYFQMVHNTVVNGITESTRQDKFIQEIKCISYRGLSTELL